MKRRNFRFPVSPGSAEALVRCGGKIRYILIAYFLSNISAKNCRNRTVYVKIIASCKGGTFFETQCIIIIIEILLVCSLFITLKLIKICQYLTANIERVPLV